MHTYTAHAPVVLAKGTRPETSPLTAQSRGRGSWDCLRQMQMYRRRPDVLAAALRDMGVLPDGHYEDESPEQTADGHQEDNLQKYSDN